MVQNTGNVPPAKFSYVRNHWFRNSGWHDIHSADKKFKIRTVNNEAIKIIPKTYHKGFIYGGIIFGIGWAITGACPGPLFAQVGSGATVVIVTLISAIAGTWVYGYLKPKLPH